MVGRLYVVKRWTERNKFNTKFSNKRQIWFGFLSGASGNNVNLRTWKKHLIGSKYDWEAKPVEIIFDLQDINYATGKNKKWGGGININR